MSPRAWATYLALLLSLAACSSQSDQTIRVNALDCALEIPADYHVSVAARGGVSFFRESDLTSIEVALLAPSFPSNDSLVSQGTAASGPLTIERFTYRPGGKQPAPAALTVVRGRAEQLIFMGVPSTEVEQYVAQCLKSMDRAVLAAHARSSGGCGSTISLREAMAVIVGRGRPQAVFSSGALVGWRIYETETVSHLAEQGIAEGSLLTHLCEVPAAEALVSSERICCPTDVSREIGATFRLAGQQSKSIVVSRGP